MTQAPMEALSILRQREMQAIGAAISNRNWHAVEAAYNEARDRLDRDILPAVGAIQPEPSNEGALNALRSLRRAVEETGIHRDEANIAAAMEQATIVLGRGY